MTDTEPISSSSEQIAVKPRVSESVFILDRYSKALTGRTPERIQDETGISRDILFPPDKKILYVGDPWQRMGKEIDTPLLTIIDYEYGEVASFERNPDRFHDIAHYRVESRLRSVDLLLEHSEITDSDRNWLHNFRTAIASADSLTTACKGDLADYPRVADAWLAARQMIEEEYRTEKEAQASVDAGDPGNRRDDISYFRTDAWYDCVYGERGLRDIHDYETIIVPRRETKRKELEQAHLPTTEIDSQLESWTHTWINEIRLKKKPEHAGVVVAVFPELPFTDSSFDRLVASWSVSAHVFSELDVDGFTECWQETHRVLAAEGEAYFFPLHYSEFDQYSMIESLRQLEKDTGAEYKFINNIGEIVPDSELDYAHTLCIRKK